MIELEPNSRIAYGTAFSHEWWEVCFKIFRYKVLLGEGMVFESLGFRPQVTRFRCNHATYLYFATDT